MLVIKTLEYTAIYVRVVPISMKTFQDVLVRKYNGQVLYTVLDGFPTVCVMSLFGLSFYDDLE